MKKAQWYFDFISPFAYLQLARFHELPDDVEIELSLTLKSFSKTEQKGPECHTFFVPKRD